MNKLILTLFAILSIGAAANGQTTFRNLGVRTLNPNSTATVSGSLSAKYFAEGVFNYYMQDTDYYVVFTGFSALPAGTITLPHAVSGNGNLKGRVYTVRNSTNSPNAAILSVVGFSATETIDGQAVISVPSNGTIQLINTGATSGTVWEIISLTATRALVRSSVFSIADSASQAFTASSFNSSTPQTITFPKTGITVNSGGIATYNDTTSEVTILQNGTYKLEGFANYNSGGTTAGSIGVGINIAFTVNGVVVNATRFNFPGFIADNYNNSLLAGTELVLAAGDKVTLVEYKGAGGNASAPASNNPIGVGESKRFSIYKQ